MAESPDLIPVVCTLAPKGAAEQLDEWGELRQAATGVMSIEGGVRMRFPAALRDTVDDLARREATCCAFLTLDVRPAGDEITLDITSANPDAQPVIDLIAHPA